MTDTPTEFTEAVRKYATEQGIAEMAALAKGKSKGFVEKGVEVYAKA